MAPSIDDLQLFARIVELGTLSAAARERDVPVSQVTRALARLEAACGARLLHRNTHGLSLTAEGDTVLTHGRRLLDAAAEMQGELSGSGPAGWVRLSVSPVLAQAIVVPSLPTLYRRHPALHVEISADDRIVDMAREGIDVAVRSGVPGGDNLVARPIGALRRALYAAPAYAAEFGLPASVADLDRHRLIGFSGNPALNHWRSGSGKRATEYQVRGHTRTDNTAIMLALVVQGVGIARLIDLVAEPMVQRGELVRVLPGAFDIPAVPVYAVMLHERHRLPKLRACIEHLAAWVAAGPGLDQAATTVR
jgi:DNA-binding transcriptional LysR family regulator